MWVAVESPGIFVCQWRINYYLWTKSCTSGKSKNHEGSLDIPETIYQIWVVFFWILQTKLPKQRVILQFLLWDKYSCHRKQTWKDRQDTFNVWKIWIFTVNLKWLQSHISVLCCLLWKKKNVKDRASKTNHFVHWHEGEEGEKYYRIWP